MNVSELSDFIRTKYPFPIAELCQEAILETDPRSRIKKYVNLFEFTLQLLVSYGLTLNMGEDNFSDIQDNLTQILQRPSLGYWRDALFELNKCNKENIELINLNVPIKETPIYSTYIELIKPQKGNKPKNPNIGHYIDAVISFRNEKIGHGSLNKKEALHIMDSFEFSLLFFLSVIKIFQISSLIFIERVEWRDPDYIYYGTNLNQGRLKNPSNQDGIVPISPKKIYLHTRENLYPLYPFTTYNEEDDKFYIFNKTEKGKFQLKCPFDQTDAEKKFIDITFEDVFNKPKKYQKMNKSLQTLEKIKQKMEINWLTYSQENVWNQLLKLLEPPYFIVNIYGACGSGKTFLGWLLQKKSYGKFIDAGEINWKKLSNNKRIIIDRYDVSRRALRSLRTIIKINNIGQAIVLSQNKADDDIPKLGIEITSEDIEIVKANLYRELNLIVPDGKHKSLNDCFIHLEENQ